MKKYNLLSNPPITETIFDFRVKLSPTFNIEEIKKVKNEIRKEYPKMQEMNFFDLQFGVNNKSISTRSQRELRGFLFKSEDEKNIAQFRFDGFTFNRLKPYSKWDNIYLESKKLWEFYKSITKPIMVSRIAVRYINHIELPNIENIEFSDYLKVPPLVPKNTSNCINNFLTKVTINYPENNIYANLIQSFEINLNNNKPIIILDIDVYKEQEFSKDDNNIWTVFDSFHEIKNDIFFNSITNKTLEIYK